MTDPFRRAAKLFLIVQITTALACSGAGGPAAPPADAGARLSGLLTTSDVSGAGDAFRGADALAGARLDLVGPSGATVASVTTGPTGSFSAALAPGGYTVSLAMSEGPPLQFDVDLPPGGALFAAGRVERTPAGGFTLNVQVFHDEDFDTAPDDPFRIQILDLEAGDPESGFQDVVASAEEAAETVTLCHVPPGNPDAAHTVTVGAPAVGAHLAHGDVEGACVDDAEEGTGEDPEAEEPESEEGEEDGVTVLVCHVPPGNPDAAHTIEVAESALPAHLAHGDAEGACADDAGTGEEPEEEAEGDAETATVLVCHVPPGNPDAAHTIEVAESALPAHLAHGDAEGACAEAPPVEDGGEVAG